MDETGCDYISQVKPPPLLMMNFTEFLTYEPALYKAVMGETWKRWYTKEAET